MRDPIKFGDSKIISIIPVKNEASGIGGVIESLRKYDTEIIVIDGNSSDNTVKIAEHYNVKVLNGEGKGKGHDIRLFQNYIRKYPQTFDICVMLDGDMTYNPDDIGKMVEPIEKGEADVVVGSRHDKIKADPGSLLNVTRFGNFILTRTAGFLYQRPDITDICSGYWAFSKEFFTNVPILSEKFDLECELFNHAIRNYRLKTIPISFRKRAGYTKLGLLGATRIPFYFAKYFGLSMLRK